jgi:hypothetical protein
MRARKLKNYYPTLVSVAVIVLLVLLSIFLARPAQSAANDITGWAWTQTVGWIELNCSTDAAGCSSAAGVWGLQSNAGAVTGYAWSDHVGWIRPATAGDGCPGNGATLTGSNFAGWFKVDKFASGEGCISLSGTSPTYGANTNANATYDPAVSAGWGDGVIGWAAFNASGGCTPTFSCSGNSSVNSCGGSTACGVVGCDGTTGQCRIGPSTNGCVSVGTDVRGPTASCANAAKTLLVRSGSSVSVYWNTQGVTTCTVSGGGQTSTGTTGQTAITNVTNQTLVSLSCDSGALTDQAVINIIPVFREN